MQKKIIVLAIAGALAAPAMALAEATVYGQVNLSIDMVKAGDTAYTGNFIDNDSANQLNSNGSRIGFKGSEDLGGGNSVVWTLEGDVYADSGHAGAGGTASVSTTSGFGSTSPAQLFNRASNIGLKNDSMGTLLLGRMDIPYKMSTRKLDVFGDTAADNRSLMGNLGSAGGGLDLVTSNTIAYVSPNFSGITVAVASVFGAENTGTATSAVAPKKGSATDLGIMYSMEGIYAALDILNVKLGDAGTGDLGENNFSSIANGNLVVDDKISSTKLGGGYTTDQFAVNLVFEQPKVTIAAGGDVKSTNIYLGGKFNVSSTDAAKLAYTKRGASKSAGVSNVDGASQVSIGYDHGMSKNTTVYALYSKISAEDDPTAAPVTNPDPSVLSFGIKHSF